MISDTRAFLERHLQAIFDNDIDTYHATTVEDLSLYEWYIVATRIDGIPFHDFMMTEAARPDSKGAALAPDAAGLTEKPRTRFDLANFREQRYGDTTILSYTMLLSQGTSAGVKVRSYNESRVLVKFADGWKVVHVHKSPAYRSPLDPPE